MVDRTQQVHFAKDDLAMYYTDIYEANFLKDESNRICVVDFEQAGVAPSAFMAMVLKSHKNLELANLVLPHLPRLQQVTKSTLTCMELAAYVHQIGSFK
jgi:thiamine kinase-like enzyme